jgi:hypothetical protein
LIPQPYPIWIQPDGERTRLLVIGWAPNGDDADDLDPIVIKDDSIAPGRAFLFPGDYYLISPDTP